MSVSGNASRKTSSEKSHTNQEIDPWVKARLGAGYDRASLLASQPYQPYQGQRVAGFTPTQTQGRNMTLGALGVRATPRPTPVAAPGPMQAQTPVAPPQIPPMALGQSPVRPITSPQDIAQGAMYGFMGARPRTANAFDGAPDLALGMDERGPPLIGERFDSPVADPGVNMDGLPGYGVAGGLGYNDDFSHDPSAAAGYGTLQDAIGATRGVLGMNPAAIHAPRAQTYGFGGVDLGDPSLLSDGGGVASAGYERFGGARLGEAALTEGRDITADLIARGDVRDVTGATAAGGIDPYLNPYLRDVVDTSLGDIERQRGLQQVQNDTRAAGARAFGSRNDIVTAETNRAALDAGARTAAELRARGYDTALGASQADQARALQAGLANQGVDLSVAGQNAGARNQASALNQADARAINLANQDARNQFALTQGQFDQQAGINNSQLSAQTSIANAGFQNQGLFRDQDARNHFRLTQGQFGQQAGLATQDAFNRAGLADQDASLTAQQANLQGALGLGQLRLGAGAQLGGFAATQRANALGDAGIMMGLGAGEQAMQQAYLDALYEAHQQQQQWPYMQQQMLNQSLGLLPRVIDEDFKRKGSGTEIGIGAKANVAQAFGLPTHLIPTG